MEEKTIEYKLAVYSIAINAAALLFAFAALLLWGPIEALAVFLFTITILLVFVYWKTLEKETENLDEDDQ